MAQLFLGWIYSKEKNKCNNSRCRRGRSFGRKPYICVFFSCSVVDSERLAACCDSPDLIAVDICRGNAGGIMEGKMGTGGKGGGGPCSEQFMK